MATLFFDIESLPTQNTAIISSIKESIKHPGNISRPETIEKWYAENLDSAFNDAYRKTALDGLYCEIASIAWAINDNPVQSIIRRNGMTERELLEAFLTELSDAKDERGNRSAITKWVGHNISGFDLRVIWQRCVMNQYNPPVKIPYDAKPWDGDIFDTRVAWAGAGFNGGASSLDKMCKAFGFDGKGDIDGSKVYDYWLEGRLDEIEEYNRQDVEKVRLLYKRMTFQE